MASSERVSRRHSIKKEEKVLKDFSQGVGLRINNVTLW